MRASTKEHATSKMGVWHMQKLVKVRLRKKSFEMKNRNTHTQPPSR